MSLNAEPRWKEVWAGRSTARSVVRVPPSDQELMSGVVWGLPEVPNTPAYWSVRCRWEDDLPDYVARNGNLVEETGFCLLGGYGITYEVNVAAFERLKSHGIFCLETTSCRAQLGQLLSEPLIIGDRSVRYRFPNQRADRLTQMLEKFRWSEVGDLAPLEMREALQKIAGVGPKTASWIVRNVLDSDEVAIIDVHILRACCMMGVFPENNSLPKDYIKLENRFLEFSQAIEVRPSVLDAVMWLEMRSVPARQWLKH